MSNLRTIIGVDPGGTTGIAVYWGGELQLAEFEAPVEAVHFLEDLATTCHGAMFVVERYIITPATAKMSQQHDALEIIGVVKYLARKYMHDIVLQSPSEAKSFATDEKLRRFGWYRRGEGHARDASRHVLTYVARNGLINLEDLIG